MYNQSSNTELLHKGCIIMMLKIHLHTIWIKIERIEGFKKVRHNVMFQTICTCIS